MITIAITFEIDPTPRRADGEFMAHAKITSPAVAGEASQIFMSGDLAGFDAAATPLNMHATGLATGSTRATKLWF